MCWLLLVCVCAAAGCRLIRVAADGSSGLSNAVDLYNSASGTWSTAQLSVVNAYLAATSVGNVAIFAGGVGFVPGGNSCSAWRDGEFLLELPCVKDTSELCCFLPFCICGEEVAV